MNRLPAGMYRPGTSALHRLDAGVKLLSLFMLLIAVVSTDTLGGYAGLLLFAGALIKLSEIGVFSMLRSVSMLSLFFAVILLMNCCFYGSERPWVSLWIFRPSYEGLMQGVRVAVRMFLLSVLSNILTATTAPIAMTNAIERMLSPLRLLKIPTGQIAMILSVAIRFIPVLSEEAETIRKAQTARGARFDSPKFTDKAKAFIPLVIPVFIAAFKDADDLALAMEARGYRTDIPIRRKAFVMLKHRDCIALLLCIAVTALYVTVE